MTRTFRSPPEKFISLREAKANLSSLTRQARAGTRVIITNHGTPIADLVQHGVGLAPAIYLKRPGPLPEVILLQGPGLSAAKSVRSDREG